jgi:hypothetical protein
MLPGEPNLRGILDIAEEFGAGGPPAGFKSAILVYEPRILSQLYEVNPHFRVLVGLRDPVEWAWSWYWYQRRNVEDACRREGPQTPGGKLLFSSRVFHRERLSGVTALDFIQGDVAYPNRSRRDGLFHVVLEEIYACLPPEQVMLFDVSQLAADWPRAVAGCLGFIQPDRPVPHAIHGNENARKPATGMAPNFEISAYRYYRDSYEQLSRFVAARGYCELSQLFSQRAQERSRQGGLGGKSAA